MPLTPIILSVRRESKTAGAVFLSRSRLKAITDKVLWRDAFTCRCCGFQSEKYQRVLQLDFSKDSPEAFITVCSFCEQCFTLDRVGLTGGGVLVWLPEITQADLHHIMRAIYVARFEGGELAAVATKAYDALLARRTEAKKRLGSDDPLLLATVFQENLTPAEYKASASKIEGIRFFPFDRWPVRGKDGDTNHFPEIVKFWRSPKGPFAKIPVETWRALFDSVIGKTGGV